MEEEICQHCLPLKVESIRSLFYHEHCARRLQLKQGHHLISTQLLTAPTTNQQEFIQILGVISFAVSSILLFSRRCTVVPALLAEGMPTIVVEEMEVAPVIKDLAAPLAFPVLLGWDTVAPTALEAVEGVLVEQEARRFPWRTSSPSTLRTPPQDPCT